MRAQRVQNSRNEAHSGPIGEPSPVERRTHRFVPALCASCGAPHTGVVSRTSCVVYVRCGDCGWVMERDEARTGADVMMAQSVRYKGPERRHRNRVKILCCDMCGSRDTPVFARMPSWLYVRCARCAYIWTTARKPELEPSRT